MFSFDRCCVKDCHTYALPDSPYCYHHSLDKEAVRNRLLSRVKEERRLENISLVNAEFEDEDFSSCFIGFSNFSFCKFSNCDFSGSRFLSTFFDYAVFENCTLRDTEGRYNVFSGAMIIRSDFL